MPHTQRQQADSRGRGLLSLLLLPILLLLSSLSPQPSQAALLIPPNFKKPPVITAQPESITVFGAEDIGLTCDATGNPPPAFRWTKDGEEFIPSDDPGLMVSKGSGTFYAAAGAALGPIKQYQGKYTCYASNELGTAVSNEVQLTTDQPPALQKERKVKKKAEEGESVVLKCNPPISTMEPVIHWMDRRLRHLQLSERVMLGKDGNLYFAHVTLDDSRSDYTCNVQYLAARTILPKEPITLTVSASNSVVRNRRPQMMSPTDTHSTYLALRGQTLELECIVQGLPTPSVQWVRKDGQLSESRVTRDQFDRRLRLTDIAEGDGGEYQCIANNTQGKVKHTYIVSVEAAPHWTKTPVSQVYAPGETVRLDCQADGIPSPTFSWSINGLPLSSVDPESRRSVLDGVLILEEVKFGDTAVYQCQAQNKHGTILINTNVFVIELPPQILSQDGRTYTAVDGQRAELDCDSFGSPRPTVSWESEGAPSLLADPRVNLLTNGSLQITNVSHGDSALYTCSVGKGNQSISISAELEVLNRTVILSAPQDLRVQPGMVAIFTCLYRVDPKLTPPHIQWRKSGQKIFPSYDEDKFTFEGPDLMVASVQTEDEGVYTCEVITDLDMAEASGSITVVDRPGPPTMLQLSDPEERSVTLSWTPGEDHNSPVLEYVVEFEDQSVTGLGWEELDRVGGDQESAVLTLWPYMSYHFRVIAINDIGISEPSAPSDLHSTPPQVPDDNPEDVRSESMHPETLLITWEKMDKRRFNGPAFRYRVFWRRVVGSGPAWHSNVTTAPPFVVTSGVGNFSAFEIKVQAVNQNGEGPAPDPVIGYSGEDLPLEAPMGVGVELMNSTAIKVMWAAVNRETVRGHLLGYKIRLTRFGSRGHHRGRREWEPEVTTVVETGATEEKRVIGGLRPYSHYALTASVVNSKGEGPPSESLPFMTEEGAPGRPMSLHLESPGETVMTLRWAPPAQPNGILTGYLLQYQQIVDSEDSPMQMENINNHSVTQLTLKGLDPHSRYRFYLRGRTSAGEGEPIIKDGATMLDGAPPNNFSLSVGDKSVNLSWVSKERQQSVGFQIHYLNKNGGGKWKLTEKVNSSLTFYQLQGLTPGSLYRVKVTFNNSTVWETDIQTEGTGVVEEQMSFATQGWFIVLVCVLVLLLLILLSLCFIKRNKGGKYSVKDKEEGQVDSEARPMKDETFGEYRSLESDLEEKRTASQPSLCDDSKLCTSEDNLDEYNGSSAVTEVNMDSSLVSQYSRMPSEGPDAGPGLESSPLNPPADPAAANGVPNSSAILDDILTSLTSNPGLEEQNMI